MGKLRLFCAIVLSCFHVSGMQTYEAQLPGVYVYVPGQSDKIRLCELTDEHVSKLLAEQGYLTQLLPQLLKLELAIDMANVAMGELDRMQYPPRESGAYAPPDYLLRGYHFNSPLSKILLVKYVRQGGNPRRVESWFKEWGFTVGKWKDIMFSLIDDLETPLVGVSDNVPSEHTCECFMSPGNGKSLKDLTYSDILWGKFGTDDVYKDLEYMWLEVLPRIIDSLLQSKSSSEAPSLVCDLVDYMAIKGQKTKECLLFEGLILCDPGLFKEYKERTNRDTWRFLRGKKSSGCRDGKKVGLELIIKSFNMGYQRAKDVVKRVFEPLRALGDENVESSS